MAWQSSNSTLIRVSLYLKKREDITDDQFHKYWADNHVRVASEHSNFSHLVKRYNQFHCTPQMKEVAKAAGAHGIPTLPYDGIAELWVESLEDWMKISSDPAFTGAIGEDEKNFMQKPPTILFGVDELKIDRDSGYDWLEDPKGGKKGQ